jgi:DNA-binding NtrC family response regulator
MPKFLEYCLGFHLAEDRFPTLEDLKKEYIEYLLDLTGFNLKETAKILNISRRTLANSLIKYKISRPLKRWNENPYSLSSS